MEIYKQWYCVVVVALASKKSKTLTDVCSIDTVGQLDCCIAGVSYIKKHVVVAGHCLAYSFSLTLLQLFRHTGNE